MSLPVWYSRSTARKSWCPSTRRWSAIRKFQALKAVTLGRHVDTGSELFHFFGSQWDSFIHFGPPCKLWVVSLFPFFFIYSPLGPIQLDCRRRRCWRQGLCPSADGMVFPHLIWQVQCRRIFCASTIAFQSVLTQLQNCSLCSIEEGWKQKARQISSRLFGRQNLFNSLPR